MMEKPQPKPMRRRLVSHSCSTFDLHLVQLFADLVHCDIQGRVVHHVIDEGAVAHLGEHRIHPGAPARQPGFLLPNISIGILKLF